MQFTRLTPKFEKTVEWAMFWYCPGCDTLHPIYLKHPDNSQASWDWNNDLENPTFSPSFLTRWETSPGKKHVCHTFIREGKVIYLGDCTHSYANKTIELMDIPDDH